MESRKCDREGRRTWEKRVCNRGREEPQSRVSSGGVSTERTDGGLRTPVGSTDMEVRDPPESRTPPWTSDSPGLRDRTHTPLVSFDPTSQALGGGRPIWTILLVDGKRLRESSYHRFGLKCQPLFPSLSPHQRVTGVSSSPTSNV